MNRSLIFLAVVSIGATFLSTANARPSDGEGQARSAGQQPPDANVAGTRDENLGSGSSDRPRTEAAKKPLVTEPKAPKSRHQRKLYGRVTDALTGEPIKGAVVVVVKGGHGRAETDASGRYSLKLESGRYTIRFSGDTHAPKRARLRLSSRRYQLDVSLKASDSAVQVLVVEVPAETKTEAGSLQIRRLATTVSDSLSAQEMSKSPDSNAAGAVKRVVSATIVDGKYVLVRGIGGRYMTTLLNGVTLPSPEPDKQAVPLDLFPTSLLANLTVAKSYSARTPGTFAGGTLMIETNSYPADFTLDFKLSSSANSSTTTEQRNIYSGGKFDALGFDDGSRSLPGSVPADQPLRVSQTLDSATMERVGEDFDNNWQLNRRSTLPDMSVGMTVGDTVYFNRKKLGYLGTVGYGHTLDVREASVGKIKNGDQGLSYREQTTSLRGTESATVGGLANVGYEFHENHRLTLLSLYTHTGEAAATSVTGVNETDGEGIEASRLKFFSRSLSFTQVAGRHRLPDLGDLRLRWQTNIAFTSRAEPDTRDITYNVLADGRRRFKTDPGSGERFFSDLSETRIGGGADLELPTANVTYRAGAVAQNSDRTFSARRFRMTFIGSDPTVLFEPEDRIFRPENIGPAFQLQERTLATDAYDASLTLFAGYGEAEVVATKNFRLIGGLRYEASDQHMVPGNDFGLGNIDDEDVTTRKDKDLLPALSAVYGVTNRLNMRAAYSYTLARPQFRELAPFLYFDYTRRRSVSGNPGLGTTRIHNSDLRWEWFPSDTEVFAASAFYKKFRAPIEQVIVSASGGDISFDNAAGATLYGAELESRMSLGHLAQALEAFRAQLNVSVIRSRIQLTDKQVMSQTNAERPLQGQSPYIVNLGLSYSDASSGLDLNIFYNVAGARIAEVGFDSLPDVYDAPFHRVDITASKRINDRLVLKVAGKNLLNQASRLRQGGLSIFSYNPGASLSASLRWSPLK